VLLNPGDSMVRAMKRFQQLLVQAKDGLAPWESFPQERIPVVAGALAASDIIDIIAELDRLAREKDETPAWDGDAHDDIARAQQLFAWLLASVPAPLISNVTAGLQTATRQTRDWVALALRECGDPPST
jgi:hypothetical protein